MFDFIKKLFSPKRTSLLPEALRPELYWEIPLDQASAVFPESNNEIYSCDYGETGVNVTAKKPNKFIWHEMPGKIFSDFMLDIDIILPEALLKGTTAMHYAAGLSFRMSDNATFLFFGISNTGYARLDCLINGEPLALTGWVECPWLEGNLINVILIARETHYTVFLNGKFALEAEDDTVKEGNIALAVQVYSKPAPVTIRFDNLIIESRPMEVELAYSRFTNFLAHHFPDQRRRLIDSFMSIQAWIPALIQLKRIEEHDTLCERDRFNRAECYIQEFMYKEAMQELTAISQTYENFEQVQLEIFNLLYLEGSYLKLKEKLLSEGSFTNPLHCNLLGHAFFNLGDFDKALDWYEKAFTLNPSMPLFAMNAARSAEYVHNTSKAIDLWNKAALELYKQQAYNDTKTCIEHLKNLHADAQFILALEARMAYAEKNFKHAEFLLKKLDALQALDAGSAYLLGMLEKQKDSEKALLYFKKALEREPDNALYHFRYTETLWLLNKPCEEALVEALQHAGTNGWIHNLAGQIACAQGNHEQAKGYFETALELLPHETQIRINLADTLNTLGNFEEAKTVLEKDEDSPALINALGNLYAVNHDPETALAYYQKALSITKKSDPLYFDILYNQSAASMELEQYARAQDALRILLEHDSNDFKALVLMGDSWNKLGDYIRAELSWSHAAEVFENPEVLERLGSLYITLNKPKKLHKLIEKLRQIHADALAEKLESSYDNAIHQTLSCLACGRIWKIPRTLPQTLSPVKLHGEIPDDLPAGICPSCNALYCVQCAKEHLEEGRFICHVCNVRLTVNKPEILWIYNNWKQKRSTM